MGDKGFYNQLTNLYPVTKTLRFALLPVGETREFLDTKLLLEADETLAANYKELKKLVDKYHKKVIAETLDAGELPVSLLEDYESKVRADEDVEDVEEKLRKEVANILTAHPDFKKLFGKDLVTELLPTIAETEEEHNIVSSFSRFTSYLVNYNSKRRALYTAEENRLAVATRTINENLPRFVNNMKVYEQLSETDISLYPEIAQLEKHLGEICLDKMCDIHGFNHVLGQKGIEFYNQVITGVTTDRGLIKGLNAIISEYNSQNKQRLPLFTPLYKQMLSDTDTKSFVLAEVFETDTDVLEALKKSFEELERMLYGTGEPSVMDVYGDLSQHDTSGMYINADKDLTILSNSVYGSWSALNECISTAYDDAYTGKKKIGTSAYDAEKEKALKGKKCYSLDELQEFADCHMESGVRIADAFEKRVITLISDIKEKQGALSYAMGTHKVEKSVRKNTALVSCIKNYLDSILELLRFLSLLDGNKNQMGRDEAFYAKHVAIMDTYRINGFTPLYNKTRNYITKKEHSDDKIKLNFGVATLLAGWDVNKESDNLGTIFLKDGKYYLGIVDSNYRKGFKDIPVTADNEEYYEKMEYKLLPTPNKMLPHVFFSKSGIEKYTPSEEVMRIYKSGSFKKGNNFSLEDCHTLIDFYKDAISQVEDWKVFDYKFSDTASYNDIGEFFREVTDQGYSMRMKKVPASYVDEMVSDGRMYLFQIYCKDFAENSKGKLDLQTIYFKMLFDSRNLECPVYKLNGGAEVFYRKPSINIEDAVVHKKGDTLISKNPLNATQKKVAKWDIVKEKRYTKEQFMLHVPVTLNFVSKNQSYMNQTVNGIIKELDDYHVLGIHRGERNLIYATVINSKGEIVDGQQYSLNVITNEYSGGKQKVDYHQLLENREGERDEARKNWQSIEQIKDLKTGYLSHAIHAITQLAIKYNAFIVIENLDTGFVRGRQKIEKQVYQNFERMLIQKLNFLVIDKDRSLENVQIPGGALAAYQLTGPFESFAKLGNQSGILFRVPTWGISGTDPVTGFTNMLWPNYETIDKSKRYFEKFDSIRYNPERDYFEFSFDYGNFNSKAEGTKTGWTVCTYGRRIKVFRNPEKQNKWDSMDYYPTEEFRALLDERGISYATGDCLKDIILEQNDAAFFKGLTEVIKMTLQMKNTGFTTEPEDDFFQSCVMNADGTFYNSRIAPEKLPRSVDANGAYNIARKGIILIEKIRHAEENEKIKLFVSNKEWLQYAQK